MNKRFALVILLMFPLYALAQDSLMLRRISSHILAEGRCYEDLRDLCKNIGHRLTGSPQAARAVIWAEQKLNEAGADRAWKQAVMVPVWKRGKEQLSFQFDAQREKLEVVPMLSLGNSEGTKGRTLSGEVIMVYSMEEWERLSAKQVKGKFVFFNYRFPQEEPNTFSGYGGAAYYRVHTANLAEGKGAIGVIIRSVSTGMDDEPHTGMMRYADTLKRKIPAVAIGNISADKLAQHLSKGVVKAHLNSECGMEKEETLSHNVIGEIRGKRFPNKIILVGGHLDSWDVGEGAHDDGAGIVQSIEVLRAFKALGWQPNYTIRVVCFMNEENGLKGGRVYADSARRTDEQHLLAIESDAGGFSPRGIGLKTKDAVLRKKIQSLLPQLLYMGVHDYDKVAGGADINPLEDQCKVLSGLLPDPQRYFDIHHTAADVFEAVNHRELKLGAAAMAGFIYLLDTHLIFE